MLFLFQMFVSLFIILTTEAGFLNILGTSSARVKHELYFISSCLARAQLVPRMSKKRASGIWENGEAMHSREKAKAQFDSFISVYL